MIRERLVLVQKNVDILVIDNKKRDKAIYKRGVIYSGLQILWENLRINMCIDYMLCFPPQFQGIIVMTHAKH